MTRRDSHIPEDDRPGVLIIGNFLSGSVGVRCVCEDLAERLRARGWRVLTASSAANRAARLLDMLLTAWFKRGRYSVAQIDVYADLAFIYAEVIAASLRLLRCPYVLTLHGGALPDFAKRRPNRMRRLLENAAVVTAPSSYHQEGLREFRPDIRVVRNGLDLGLYKTRRLTAAKPRLVWLRAFHETYNPLLAIDVVHLLRARFPEVELLMVGPDKGDGTYAQTLGRINSLGLGGRVRVLGVVPKTKVPLALQEGDIFLNTTNVDNTPVTVVEAMACGLCVVSTDVGGVPRLLSDGVDALLVPPRDATAMAAAVGRIVDDPSLAARLSANARQTAEEFDWGTVLTVWEQLFAQVTASGGPPATA
jgi:glycosyltransferase involved in cell wall biosynthesis